MHINITGHQLEVTSALRDYVTNKIGRLENHFDRITNIQVTLKIEKQRQLAEATIHVSNGAVFANSESEDLYAAIDSLADKLDRQLVKHKEKRLDRKKH